MMCNWYQLQFVLESINTNGIIYFIYPGSGKSGYWRSFLRGFFHGAGAETRDPIAQGKENHMDKSLFSRRPLSETYSVRNVLDSYGDTPVCEAVYPTRGHTGPDSLCVLFFWLSSVSMWDVSSPTRDRTHPLRWKHGISTTRPPGKSGPSV